MVRLSAPAMPVSQRVEADPDAEQNMRQNACRNLSPKTEQERPTPRT